MPQSLENLEALASSLPLPEESQATSTIQDQARSVLRLIRENAASPVLLPPLTPAGCPNCGGPATSLRSPYCGEACRELAGFVRQFRSGLREATLLDPERQVALGQILWKLLGGGLPLRNSLIEPKALARLFKKAEGRCQTCGGTATTVDHLGSHCNRTSNLLPVCDECAQTKPFGSPDVLGRPETRERLRELSARIASETPLRPCDDAETWDWRAYVAARKP